MGSFLSSCRRIYLVVFLIVVLLITVAFVYLVPIMAPLKPGRAADFWVCATGAAIDDEAKIAKDQGWNFGAWTSQTRYGSYSPFLEDGWAIYERGGIHGSTLYKVREDEILAVFPEVEKIIQTGIANSNANREIHAVGIMPAYTEWKASENPDPLLLPGLAKGHFIKYGMAEGKTDLVGHLHQASMPPAERLYASRWYASGVVFEWCFLCGLVLFVLWPGLRRLGYRRFAIHLAALPVLFFLPCFFGYASASYFTHIGATGGVVYPFLLMVARLPVLPVLDSIDLAVLPFIPQILQALSADPGSIVSWSGATSCGPFSILGYSLLLFLILLLRYTPRLPRLLRVARIRLNRVTATATSAKPRSSRPAPRMSNSENPYQAPAEASGIPSSYNRDRWTHSWTDTAGKKGEVGLIIEADALTVCVPEKQLFQKVPRETHFEHMLLGRSWLMLPKPDKFSLILPPDVRSAVDQWRGLPTRDWLRHDLMHSGSKPFLMAGLLGVNLILSVSFINGGLVMLYPLSSALLLIGMLIYLAKGLIAPRLPHRIWFIAELLGFGAFILSVILDRSGFKMVSWVVVALGLFAFWGIFLRARVHFAKRNPATPAESSS